jgi:hypothetical protein
LFSMTICPEELEGNNVNILMPQPYSQQHNGQGLPLVHFST